MFYFEKYPVCVCVCVEREGGMCAFMSVYICVNVSSCETAVKITPFRFLLGHTLWVLLSFLLLQYWGLHTGDPAKEQQKKSKLIKSLCVCVL